MTRVKYLPTIRYATTDEWVHEYEDNERQRNTERHAAKIEPFLQQFLPQHAVVHAAELPNGHLIKLDGHTRAFLWHQKRIPEPPTLMVMVHAAKTLDEAKEMYRVYDNAVSAEGATDKVFGALREHGIIVTSPFLRQGYLSTTLRLADWARLTTLPVVRGDWDHYESVGEWAEEIGILDWFFTQEGSVYSLHAGLMAAVLLSVRKYGFQEVRGFWVNYMTRAEGRTTDPHVVLRTHMLERQARKRTGGFSNCKDIAEKALSALEHDMRGNSIKKLVGTNLTKYLSATDRQSVGHKLQLSRGYRGDSNGGGVSVEHAAASTP